MTILFAIQGNTSHMYFTNLNLPVEGGVIKPGLDVVVGCTYFMALITLSLFFRRGGGWGGPYGAI